MKLVARTIALCLATALVLGVFALPAQAQQPNNPGTIKVHDDETERPPERNVPHVSCDFWIEGFNMEDDSGTIKFFAWPPTGDKEEVTPTGDNLTWTSDSTNEQGNHHFLKGPYQLPEGHYRVEVYSDEGHPGGGPKFVKTKTFWVDPCEPEQPPEEELECPVNLSAQAQSNGSILLTWESPDGDFQYNIYRAVGSGEFEYVTTVDDTSYLDTNTTVGVTYRYIVATFDGENEAQDCAPVEATAIPFFPTAVVGVLALAGSLAGFVMLRRRS